MGSLLKSFFLSITTIVIVIDNNKKSKNIEIKRNNSYNS